MKRPSAKLRLRQARHRRARFGRLPSDPTATRFRHRGRGDDLSGSPGDLLATEARPWRAPIHSVQVPHMRSPDQRTVVTDEQRVTRFGLLLRSTSLDEMPSLWNVLKGDMSLVGPRPLLLEYLDRYSPEQARRPKHGQALLDLPRSADATRSPGKRSSAWMSNMSTQEAEPGPVNPRPHSELGSHPTGNQRGRPCDDGEVRRAGCLTPSLSSAPAVSDETLDVIEAINAARKRPRWTVLGVADVSSELALTRLAARGYLHLGGTAEVLTQREAGFLRDRRWKAGGETRHSRSVRRGRVGRGHARAPAR